MSNSRDALLEIAKITDRSPLARDLRVHRLAVSALDDVLLEDPEKASELRAMIVRLCHLQEEVAEHVIGYDSPNDCLCGSGGFWLGDEWPSPRSSWTHDGKTIDWIEAAVRAEIARSKSRFPRLKALAFRLHDLAARLAVGAETARKSPTYYHF